MIAAQWREFLAGDPVPGRAEDERYGIMCGADDSTLEYMCGVRVESFEGLQQNWGRIRVPAQTYAVFRPRGTAPLHVTWQRILAWLDQGEWASAHQPDFERYPPGAQSGVTDDVEIWVGVLPRDGAAGS